MIHERCKIVLNEQIETGIFKLVVENTEMANMAKPGQFASIYLNSDKHLLPRPISICDVDKDCLTFIYQTVGKGTEILSQMKPSEYLRVTGTTGNGFDMELAQNASVCVLGGGIGVLPLVLLTKRLKNADCYLGFRSKSVMADLFNGMSANVNISTDDGSVGFHGNAADMLLQSRKAYDVIYACGPVPLLKAAIRIAEEMGAKCQISAEERMACGMGACVGCAFPIKTDDGFTYKRVCVDGPVFNGTEVFLDEFR